MTLNKCSYIQQIILLCHSFRPKWISIHGTKYKTGCVLWINHNEEETPCFAIVKDICIVQRDLMGSWFIAEALHTVALVKHFNAYEVNKTVNLLLVKQHQLVYPLPLHLITATDQEQVRTFVCPKYQVPV
jgi:hypothetical protein